MNRERFLEVLIAAASAVAVSSFTKAFESRWVVGAAAVAFIGLLVARLRLRTPKKEEWLRLAEWFRELAASDRPKTASRMSNPDQDPVFAMRANMIWQLRGGRDEQIRKDVELCCRTAALLLSRSSSRLYRGLNVKEQKGVDAFQVWLNIVKRADEITYRADVTTSGGGQSQQWEIDEIGEVARACARMAQRCYVLDE